MKNSPSIGDEASGKRGKRKGLGSAPGLAVLALLAILLLLWPCVASAVKPGDAAPEFSLEDLAGTSVTLSSLRGKVVIVDFWASWCVPCRKELPALDRLAKKWRQRKDVVLLAINIDSERRSAEKFLKDAGVSALRVLLDPTSHTAEAYRLPAMPSLFVIDARGIARFVHKGYRPGDERAVEREVEELVKGKRQ
ncbi:MAG: TlpA family protein disulfide reductase [Deltaproteobacteria bacterium]|nr:TlpA family protein disulfide reductase [Deltaproteobacteria bacterium]